MQLDCNTLLVEGASDQAFFEWLCRKSAFDVKVQPVVKRPKELGAEKDGKTAIWRRLPILMKGMSDGRVTRLAVVMDADYLPDGLGFNESLKKITDTIRPFGYGAPEKHASSGYVFTHNDGLNPFGAWIMPNNEFDGMFEDMLKDVIVASEIDLLDHSRKIVSELHSPKFKEIHQSKAEIATWLAWQKNPGLSIAEVSNPDLIDMNAQPIVSLQRWLKHIFE